MPSVGQIEKKTQARVVALFQQRLGYDYLGNLIDQENRNIAHLPLYRQEHARPRPVPGHLQGQPARW